jgi:hypothetical protein
MSSTPHGYHFRPSAIAFAEWVAAGGHGFLPRQVIAWTQPYSEFGCFAFFCLFFSLSGINRRQKRSSSLESSVGRVRATLPESGV